MRRVFCLVMRLEINKKNIQQKKGVLIADIEVL